jgi:hypothetical protein
VVIFLLLPALAFGFSSAPSRFCKEDAGCLLVQETYCGEIHAVALDQLKAWAGWEAKLRAKAEKEKKACTPGTRPDYHKYKAVCVKGQCEAVLKKPGEPREE